MNYDTTKDGERTKYTCNECGFIFKSRYWIRRHMIAEHSNRAALKNQIGGSTKDDADATATVSNPDYEPKDAKTPEPFRKDCHVCKKTFLNQNRLSIHLRTHKVFKCPECSQMLDQYKLPIHRNEVHGVAIPTCGICGYKNKSQYRINLHQRDVHMKEKNIHCPDCDAKFFNKAELRRHSVRHYQVKKFACSFCTKKFTRLKTLRFHERIHSGDKRMVCRICDERFVQRASLNYHVAKHHPEAV